MKRLKTLFPLMSSSSRKRGSREEVRFQDSDTSDRRLHGNDSITVIPASEPESITTRKTYNGSRRSDVSVKSGMTMLKDRISVLDGRMTKVSR